MMGSPLQSSPPTPSSPLEQTTYEPTEDLKKRMKNLSERLKKLLETQGISEKAKVQLSKLDPHDLNEYIKIVNSELSTDYFHIRKLTSKQLRRVLLNCNCLYGVHIDEEKRIRTPPNNFFKAFPEELKCPEKAIVSLESPKILAEEFTNETQLKLNSFGVAGVLFDGDFPIVLSPSENYLKAHAEASAKNTNTKIVYGGYYYPKGTILLYDLFPGLSEEAENFFQKDEVIDKKRAREFYNKFGMVVPTEIVVGGELTRMEELKKEIDVSGNNSDKNTKLSLLGLVNSWILSAEYSSHSLEESKTSGYEASQQGEFSCNGGDERFVTNATKWIASLDNPDTWKLLRVNKWRKTETFLPDEFRRQFQLLELNTPTKKDLMSKFQPEMHYQLHHNIMLDCAPSALCLSGLTLLAFFPYAVHHISILGHGSYPKRPVPWRKVHSIAVLTVEKAGPIIEEDIYVSTTEGLFKIILTGLEETIMRISKKFAMSFLLAYKGFLYVFSDKVSKLSPETGELEVVCTQDWRKVECGFVKGDKAYIIKSKILYEFDFETKNARLISKEWKNAQVIVGDPENESEIFVYDKTLFVVDTRTGDRRELNLEYKYPNYLSAVFDSRTKEIYVATKPCPHGKSKKVFLYKVQTSGIREILSVEWDSLNLPSC